MGEIHCVVQADQLLGNPRLLGIGLQVLAALLLLDLVRAGQQRLEVTVGLNQFGGDLLADARHARDVVDRIAPQRLHVDHLFGHDAELLFNVFRADHPPVHRVHHVDPGADQLHQVLVRGDDRDGRALLLGELGVGGDQVVGLVPLLFDRGDVEGAHRLPAQRDLRGQVLRHLRPVGLVLGVDVVAEAVAARIEDHRDRLAVADVAQQLQKHVGEAVDGEGRRAVGACHRRRQLVVGPENVAGPVDQIEVADAGLSFCVARGRLGRRRRGAAPGRCLTVRLLGAAVARHDVCALLRRMLSGGRVRFAKNRGRTREDA